MNEQQPAKAWDIRAINDALQADMEPAESEEHGLGVHYSLGDTGTSVAIFPQAKPPIVEVASKNVRVQIHDVSPAVIDEQGVIFRGNTETGDFATVSPSGWVFVSAASFRTTVERSPRRGEGLVFNMPPASPPPIPLTEAQPEGLLSSEQPPAEAGQRSEREKLEKIEIWGNVGYEPKYSEFKSGGVRLQFSVSRHMDDGETRWHTVKAFGARARQYQGMVHKGDAVQVVGGRAVETGKDRAGNDQQRPFIMLWGLKRLRS